MAVNLNEITAEAMKELSDLCEEFTSMHVRRSSTSKFATLGELDALMNLKVHLSRY